MKRVIVAAIVCATAVPSAWAQELRQPRLDLNAVVHQKAMELAAFQVPQVPQTPAPAPATPNVKSEAGMPLANKVLYLLTLAGATAGTIFNIIETRNALDHGLSARTFPLVWQTTSDPADKDKVTGTIALSNGTILAASGIAFLKGHAAISTFVNTLVAAATTTISLHDHAIVSDCIEHHTCN